MATRTTAEVPRSDEDGRLHNARNLYPDRIPPFSQFQKNNHKPIAPAPITHNVTQVTNANPIHLASVNAGITSNNVKLLSRGIDRIVHMPLSDATSLTTAALTMAAIQPPVAHNQPGQSIQLSMASNLGTQGGQPQPAHQGLFQSIPVAKGHVPTKTLTHINKPNINQQHISKLSGPSISISTTSVQGSITSGHPLSKNMQNVQISIQQTDKTSSIINRSSSTYLSGSSQIRSKIPVTGKSTMVIGNTIRATTIQVIPNNQNISGSKIAKIPPNRHANIDNQPPIQIQLANNIERKTDGSAIIPNINSRQSSHTPNQQLTRPSSSPKPSILRNNHDSKSIQSARKNLSGSLLMPNYSETNNNFGTINTPKTMQTITASSLDPSRDNSQSSTDTATSNDSTPVQPDVRRLKREVDDGTPSPTSELSPRKRPRKQQFNEPVDPVSTDEEYEGVVPIKFDLRNELEKINSQRQEFHKLENLKRKELKLPIGNQLKLIEIDSVLRNTHIDDNVTETFVKQVKATLERESEYVDHEGYRWTADKERQGVNLLNFCQYESKGRTNHFMRRSDVKCKDERRPTINELASAKATVLRSTGWRFYHVSSQMEEVIDSERDLLPRLERLLTEDSSLISVDSDDTKLAEIVKGNMQRVQLIIDQITDAKNSLLKLREQHSNKIKELIEKHHSKRPVKKKDR